jgi:hypothetical protein
MQAGLRRFVDAQKTLDKALVEGLGHLKSESERRI